MDITRNDEQDSSGALAGRRFAVEVLGCRVNLCEAEGVIAALVSRGGVWARDGGRVDAAVVLTCSVTGAADAKTRKTIRRLRRRCDGPLAACGCWAQTHGGEAPDLGVDIVVGSRKKHEIAPAIERWFASRAAARIVDPDVARNAEWDELAIDRPRAHVRAFIKVQDGCSRRCSYCVVPTARGAQVSRDARSAAAEVERVVGAGAREVVLTGVHLGAYRAGGVSLARLVSLVSRARGLERLRLGSLEPFALDAELLAALADSAPFCPHLHLPLQSGDDGVLAAMRRGYTAAGYARAVEAARRALGDDLHVSTDLIVGFPGESERAFENSLALIRDLGIGRVHVFPFSPREGTDAAAMPRIPADARAERQARALDAARASLERYAGRFVGVPCEILPERAEDGLAAGWTRHYLRGVAPIDGARENLSENSISFAPKSQFRGILIANGAEPNQAAVLDDDG